MKFSDVITLLDSPDRVRILQDGVEVYNGYFANLRTNQEVLERFKDTEVKRFRPIPEIKHRRWKELNLIPPLKPEETPSFSFSDLQMTLYRTIEL